MLEKRWLVRCVIDEQEALELKDGGFAIVSENKILKIQNLQYERYVWATTRNKALLKTLKKGANITQGLVSITVSDTHSNTRPKK
jgi:hypothetical protein